MATPTSSFSSSGNHFDPDHVNVDERALFAVAFGEPPAGYYGAFGGGPTGLNPFSNAGSAPYPSNLLPAGPITGQTTSVISAASGPAQSSSLFPSVAAAESGAMTSELTYDWTQPLLHNKCPTIYEHYRRSIFTTFVTQQGGELSPEDQGFIVQSLGDMIERRHEQVNFLQTYPTRDEADHAMEVFASEWTPVFVNGVENARLKQQFAIMKKEQERGNGEVAVLRGELATTQNRLTAIEEGIKKNKELGEDNACLWLQHHVALMEKEEKEKAEREKAEKEKVEKENAQGGQ